MRVFFIALMLYTKLPVPRIKDFREEDTNKALSCFSLIGWVIGIISALAFFVGEFLFNTAIGILLSLAAAALATGCLHEDGFADMLDGFGGGNSKNKILEIMKDSRIGTYGVIGTILIYLLKIFALIDIVSSPILDNKFSVILMFITYNSLARLISGNMILFSKYARNDGTSKIKIVEGGYKTKEIIGLYFFGLIPLLACLFFNPIYLLILFPLLLLFFFTKSYFEKRIGGYTGDCLGALEQMAEIVILLSIIVMNKFLA